MDARTDFQTLLNDCRASVAELLAKRMLKADLPDELPLRQELLFSPDWGELTRLRLACDCPVSLYRQGDKIEVVLDWAQAQVVGG